MWQSACTRQNELDMMQPKEIFIIARQHQFYRSSDSHCRSGLPHVLEDQLLQLKPPFVSAPSHVFVSRHQPQAIVSVHVSHFSNWRQKKSLAVPRILALTSHTVAAANIKIAIRIIRFSRSISTKLHRRKRADDRPLHVAD